MLESADREGQDATPDDVQCARVCDNNRLVGVVVAYEKHRAVGMRLHALDEDTSRVLNGIDRIG